MKYLLEAATKIKVHCTQEILSFPKAHLIYVGQITDLSGQTVGYIKMLSILAYKLSIIII